MMRTIDEMAAAVSRDPDSPLAAYARLAAQKAALPKSPLTSMLDRMMAGEPVSNEEVYETLTADAAVIIGDVATCRKKMQRYQDIGVDRLMCFQQLGHLPHEHIMKSIQLVGEHLIPVFDPK